MVDLCLCFLTTIFFCWGSEVKLQTWVPNTTTPPTPPTSSRKTTTQPPASFNGGGWISLLSSSLANWNRSNQKTTQKPMKPWKSSSWSPIKPIEPVEPTNYWSPKPKPKPQPNYEIKSTRGNTVSLITASKTPVAPSYSVTLPPEVSVSSHVIALQVKPRHRSLPAHVETIQGVGVETDASNVNLSDLIMRDPLPSSRKRFRHIQNTPHWVPY